ncbi:hypothetical protein [Blastococcus brunescens]|uniref:Sugar phosphate isomerase/epimerase n=1 Tax=Blastococcus brunescens TaxID=1564165 RepID=A0ABZ1ATM8_9ACTN|nr:hypothetical protein [Blastococcus sp. BMG 8361]WRL61927.1 hypothetical protein U6N30_17690 [Blastococcus sp. BMG 8361]
MRIAHHTITWGGVVGDPTGVTSIKDLYYRSHGSIIEAVRDIGAVGYEGTEVFDGNLAAIADDPQPFLDTLAATGVELVSVYSGANFVYADVLPDEMARLRRACELARQFGASRLVVGGGARRAMGTPEGTTVGSARHLTRWSTSRPSTGWKPATTLTCRPSWSPRTSSTGS